MLPLKLGGRFSGCQVAAWSTHGSFLKPAGLPQCGIASVRRNQADSACSDLPNAVGNQDKHDGNKKKERRFKKKSLTENSHSSPSFEESVSNSGDGEGVRKNKVKSHLYSSIYPWTTQNELVDVLMQSQLFQNDDMLVLNKPYGLAQVNTGSRVSYGLAPPPFTLADVLPTLQELVHAQSLKIAIAPEKWQSGVLVLTKNKDCANRIVRNKNVAPSLQTCVKQFWVVTRNRAYPSEKPYRVAALRGETIPSGAKVAVLEFTPTLRKVREELVDRFYATHTTIAESETTGTALMQVGVTRTMHHSVRVWLTHHLAPALGDHLYGGRVAYLLGTPVPVPHSRASSQPPYPFEMLKKIDLSPSIQDLMPLMMHLRSVTLPQYYKGKAIKHKARDLECFTDFSKGIAPSSAAGGPAQAATETTDAQLVGTLLNSGSDDSTKSIVDRTKISNNEADVKPKPDVKHDTSQSLVLTAPAPQHFAWTLERLGIKAPLI